MDGLGTLRGTSLGPVAPAPPWMRGLWRRRSLIFADGRADRDSFVVWGQTASRFIDLRLPVARLAPDAPLPTLELLAQQGGFAGDVIFADGACRWHRHIDFQPPDGSTDEALLRREGDSLFEESFDRVDGVPAYREVFEQIGTRSDSAGGMCLAFELVTLAGHAFGMVGFAPAILLLLDDVFMFARDRSRPPPPAIDLAALVIGQCEDAAGIALMLDCEISLGGLLPGPDRWHITHSTRPAREGTVLFDDLAQVNLKEQLLKITTPGGQAVWQALDLIEDKPRLLAHFRGDRA
jgi:hypothetical protein